MMNRYSYIELLNEAKTGDRESINALGEWFENFGSEYWNGEYYDTDGLRLFPIYKETDDDDFEIIGYEFK